MRSRGYEVVGTGFLARRGELDLICRRGDELVIVEVKARSGDGFGTPREAVNARKRHSMRRAVAEYRALAEWHGPVRFAVIGVTARSDGCLDLELMDDAFE